MRLDTCSWIDHLVCSGSSTSLFCPTIWDHAPWGSFPMTKKREWTIVVCIRFLNEYESGYTYSCVATYGIKPFVCLLPGYSNDESSLGHEGGIASPLLAQGWGMCREQGQEGQTMGSNVSERLDAEKTRWQRRKKISSRNDGRHVCLGCFWKWGRVRGVVVWILEAEALLLVSRSTTLGSCRSSSLMPCSGPTPALSFISVAAYQDEDHNWFFSNTRRSPVFALVQVDRRLQMF